MVFYDYETLILNLTDGKKLSYLKYNIMYEYI
jgi:hypothetical protein